MRLDEEQVMTRGSDGGIEGDILGSGIVVPIFNGIYGVCYGVV